MDILHSEPYIETTNKETAMKSLSIKDLVTMTTKSDEEYMNYVQSMRRNLVTYFNQSKLVSLFITIIDECPFIEFNTPRDRRITNRNLPTYKVKILYDKVPESIRVLLGKSRMADAKSKICHEGLITPYVTKMFEIIQKGDMEYLKEKVPDNSEMKDLVDIMTTLFIINTTDEADSPIFVRPFI